MGHARKGVRLHLLQFGKISLCLYVWVYRDCLATYLHATLLLSGKVYKKVERHWLLGTAVYAIACTPHNSVNQMVLLREFLLDSFLDFTSPTRKFHLTHSLIHKMTADLLDCGQQRL